MNGSCLISGSCLIWGFCLTSGELSGSRLIRFELGGVARAALHASNLLFRLPCEQPVQSTQSRFSLP